MNNSPTNFVDPMGLLKSPWTNALAVNTTNYFNNTTTDFYNGPTLSPSSNQKTDSSNAAKVGAAAGAIVGTVAAAGCDVSTYGLCSFSNPAIIVGATALGATTGVVIDNTWTKIRNWIFNDGAIGLSNDPNVYAKPPNNAYDPKGPKAPGKPSADAGFEDPKSGENWVPNPNPGKGGGSYGWEDAKGDVWVPSGPGGRAHGGPHWDVQTPGGGYRNVRPPKP